ncbi:hypothetical protein BJF79_48880 [Actinomadura sp. CNU-125]|nr:hypothetical protein BJF79_48880 [Actinomadura sp. CNU-125]
MIDFIFYGRIDPVGPSTAVHRLRAVSRAHEFAQRHGGRVTYDYFDEVPAQVPLEERPGGRGLIEYMLYRRQENNALLVPGIDHALGPGAWFSLAMFAAAAFPIWAFDRGDPRPNDRP